MTDSAPFVWHGTWDEFNEQVRQAWYGREGQPVTAHVGHTATDVHPASPLGSPRPVARVLPGTPSAESLDLLQMQRERDEARVQLANTQGHRERLVREHATLTRELNRLDRQLAAIREKLAPVIPDGQWLTCTEGGTLDLREELLATRKLIRETLETQP